MSLTPTTAIDFICDIARNMLVPLTSHMPIDFCLIRALDILNDGALEITNDGTVSTICKHFAIYVKVLHAPLFVIRTKRSKRHRAPPSNRTWAHHAPMIQFVN